MRIDHNARKWLAASGASLAIILSGSMLVAPNEGKVNKTYLDPIGILTSCLGHTGKELRIGQQYSDEQCYQQLSKDLSKSQDAVHKYVVVPLNVYQEAALISFTYNAGAGNLSKSTMAKKFNALDYKGGCEELVKWVYAGGKKLKGLENRRNEELAMCLGDKDAVKFVQEEVSK